MDHLHRSSQASLTAVDRQGMVLAHSRGAELLTGWTLRQVQGRPLSRFLAAGEAGRVETVLKGVLDRGGPGFIEAEVRRPDGESVPVRWEISPVEDSRGVRLGASCLLRDLREQRRIEGFLRRAEQCFQPTAIPSETLHELKNLASCLAMVGDTCSQVEVGDPRLRRLVRLLDHVVPRILTLCRDLLSPPAPRTSRQEPVDVDLLLRSLLDLVECRAAGGVQVSLDPTAERLRVRGDREQLAQVLLNLAINALQSMDGGGTLEISTRREEGWEAPLPEGYDSVTVGDVPGGLTAVILLRDQGCGIPAADLGQIFDPFFTTKGEGCGTGLGLYQARRVVTEHGGSLTVASRPGSGSLVVLCLPALPD
jgi:two-component system sensor histidine kinase HydH